MIALLVFLPFIAALTVGLSVRIISPRAAQLITCGAMVISAIFAGLIFSEFAGLAMSVQGWHDLVGGNGLIYKVHVADWITSGDFKSAWVLRVDALTADAGGGDLGIERGAYLLGWLYEP